MHTETDVILRRKMQIDTGGNRMDVEIRIHRPDPDVMSSDFRCHFEIDGLATKVISRDIIGVDEIQSVILAMKIIGTELYTSKAAKSGTLVWLEKGHGYGFPLPRNLWDLYEGEDPP
jgi:hypothetical protein